MTPREDRTAACTCGAPKGRAHTKDCALHEHTRAEFARALSAASILQEKWADGEVCDDCGSLVGPHTDSWWHADDALWLEVMDQGDPGEGPSGRRVGPGCLCPPCFTARCDAKGVRIFWHARVEYRESEDVIEGQRRAGLRD